MPTCGSWKIGEVGKNWGKLGTWLEQEGSGRAVRIAGSQRGEHTFSNKKGVFYANTNPSPYMSLRHKSLPAQGVGGIYVRFDLGCFAAQENFLWTAYMTGFTVCKSAPMSGRVVWMGQGADM